MSSQKNVFVIVECKHPYSSEYAIFEKLVNEVSLESGIPIELIVAEDDPQNTFSAFKTKILEPIKSADAVVCFLPINQEESRFDTRFNISFELGVAVAVAETKTIVIVDSKNNMPFDINNADIVFLNSSYEERLRKKLRKTLHLGSSVKSGMPESAFVESLIPIEKLLENPSLDSNAAMRLEQLDNKMRPLVLELTDVSIQKIRQILRVLRNSDFHQSRSKFLQLLIFQQENNPEFVGKVFDGNIVNQLQYYVDPYKGFGYHVLAMRLLLEYDINEGMNWLFKYSNPELGGSSDQLKKILSGLFPITGPIGQRLIDDVERRMGNVATHDDGERKTRLMESLSAMHRSLMGKG
jgi:hypothetical protein